MTLAVVRSLDWPRQLRSAAELDDFEEELIGEDALAASGSGLGAQAIREGHIFHEALVTRGDVRLRGDLFGLSVGGAERYVRVFDQDEQFSS